jgi:hypothetical protein
MINIKIILGSQFREEALLNCSEGAREGILDLSSRLRNICFVRGLASDRNQTIVRSRNYGNFYETAGTAIVEESAIASRQDRYKVEGNVPPKCSSCGKIGHTSSKCYARGKKEVRVNLVIANGTNSIKNATRFRCRERGHIARKCRKPPRKMEGCNGQHSSGNDTRLSEGSRPTVSTQQGALARKTVIT